MNELTQRERVLRAINHKEPDKIPIDFGATYATSIHVDAYRDLIAYLGIKDNDPEIRQWSQMIVNPCEELRKKFHADIYGIKPGSPTRWRGGINLRDNMWVDHFGVKYQKFKDSYYYEVVESPLQGKPLDYILNKYRWPDPYDLGWVSGLKQKAHDLYKNSDLALIMLSPGGGIFGTSAFLRGYEDLLCETLLNQGIVLALRDKLLEFFVGYWDNVLDKVGEYIQIVQISDDYAGQESMVFSPEIFRQIYKPAIKKMISFIKSKADVKIFYHLCGGVYPIIPDLIEVGVDILNPVQYTAKGMELIKLKKEFGKDLTFWGGGIDIGKTLLEGSVEEITKEVKKNISILAPGGGFVFAPVHNIQPNTPPKNILAVYNTVINGGIYPL